MTWKREFGKRLERARDAVPRDVPRDDEKRYGWSKKELADKLGIGPRMLRRYEKGEIDPRASLVVELATALGVEPGWLLAGSEPIYREHDILQPWMLGAGRRGLVPKEELGWSEEKLYQKFWPALTDALKELDYRRDFISLVRVLAGNLLVRRMGNRRKHEPPLEVGERAYILADYLTGLRGLDAAGLFDAEHGEKILDRSHRDAKRLRDSSWQDWREEKAE